MFKILLSITLLAALLFSSPFTAPEERASEPAAFYPRGLSSEKSVLKTSAERGKLRGITELDKEAGRYTKDTLIPIRVVLNFDADAEEKFEKEFEKLFGDTLKYQKTWQNDYDMYVTVEQLDLLVGLDEVLFITEPSDEDVLVEDVIETNH